MHEEPCLVPHLLEAPKLGPFVFDHRFYLRAEDPEQGFVKDVFFHAIGVVGKLFGLLLLLA